jgi:hypothetical protein
MIIRPTLFAASGLAVLCLIGAANPRRLGADFPIMQNIPSSPSAVAAVPDPTAPVAARPTAVAAAAPVKAAAIHRAAVAAAPAQDEAIVMPISAPRPDPEPAQPVESATATGSSATEGGAVDSAAGAAN